MSIKFLDLPPGPAPPGPAPPGPAPPGPPGPPGPAPPGPAPPSKTSEASEPPPTSKKNFSFFFGQNH